MGGQQPKQLLYEVPASVLAARG